MVVYFDVSHIGAPALEKLLHAIEHYARPELDEIAAFGPVQIGEMPTKNKVFLGVCSEDLSLYGSAKATEAAIVLDKALARSVASPIWPQIKKPMGPMGFVNSLQQGFNEDDLASTS